MSAASPFSPVWTAFFNQPAPAACPQRLASTARPAAGGAGQRPLRPAPPAAGPLPPRQQRELEWLTCHLPEWLRQRAIECLLETLRFRAQVEEPPLAPSNYVGEFSRFGLVGEEALRLSERERRVRWRAELREALRTIEGTQPRLVRNCRLAKHAIRLGQLARALERSYSLDPLEELYNGLALLWG